MRIRDIVLSSTGLKNGWYIGAMLGILPLPILVGLASYIGVPFVIGLAWIVSIGLAIAIPFRVYYAFLATIPPSHRAVLTYFNERQKGPQYEIEEGDFFEFDVLDMVGHIAYDMQEQTMNLPDIPVETVDRTIVKVKMSIQWGARAGALYHFGNLATPREAISNEVHECVRAYGITREDVNDLVEGKFTEALKRFIPEYINRRATGTRCAVDIRKVGDDFVAIWRDIPADEHNPNVPWGITCYSAVVKDYELPHNLTEAASEIAEAQARQKAAGILQKSTVSAIRAFRKEEIPPVPALAAAQSIVQPDRDQSAHVTVHSGLEPLAATILTGLQPIAASIAQAIAGRSAPTPRPPRRRKNRPTSPSTRS